MSREKNLRTLNPFVSAKPVAMGLRFPGLCSATPIEFGFVQSRLNNSSNRFHALAMLSQSREAPSRNYTLRDNVFNIRRRKC